MAFKSVWGFDPDEVINPVHARSNRAVAANFEMRSQSLAAGCLTVYQEGRVQLPLRPPQG
jgi:hypothetical protein